MGLESTIGETSQIASAKNWREHLERVERRRARYETKEQFPMEKSVLHVESLTPYELCVEREVGYLLPLGEAAVALAWRGLPGSSSASTLRQSTSLASLSEQVLSPFCEDVPSPFDAAHQLHRSGTSALLANLLALKQPPGSDSALARGHDLLAHRRRLTTETHYPAAAYAVDDATAHVLAKHAPATLELIEAVSGGGQKQVQKQVQSKRKTQRPSTLAVSLTAFQNQQQASALWDAAGGWQRTELFRIDRLRQQARADRRCTRRAYSATRGARAAIPGCSTLEASPSRATQPLNQPSASLASLAPRLSAHRSHIPGTTGWWRAVKGPQD